MNQQQARYIAEEVGKSYVSDWLVVDQSMIDQFADATHDWMFLHVDPEKAAQTEFGGTIAHGFLLLSLLAPLRSETPRPIFPGIRVGLNYGLDRIRFLHPVRSGSRVRAHFTVESLEEVSPGRFREEKAVEMEIEGQQKPALVATWLTMYLT